MPERTAETILGAVVLTAAVGFIVYAATTADLGLTGGSGTRLTAEFRSLGSVSEGAAVRIAGVRVGSVSEVVLDPETYNAQVTLRLQPGIEIPEDTAVKITQASLLGDSFLALDPGSSDFMLEDGGELTYTQDAVNLMDIVSRFIAGSGAPSGGGD
ncbi:MAG: outer membrane lipid asymmetry maintenance protein MlaD [Paracoccaceae bacterium]